MKHSDQVKIFNQYSEKEIGKILQESMTASRKYLQTLFTSIEKVMPIFEKYRGKDFEDPKIRKQIMREILEA